jgi:hypothetical protein
VERRSRVCLDCRSVVEGDAPCPGGPKHRVVDLTSEGRAKLVDEVWGPPSWRRERRRLARAGGGGATAGGIAEIFTGCDGCSGIELGGELGEIVGVILVILAVALIAILLVWAIGKLIAYINRKRQEPKPHGALLLPTRHYSERRVRGTVEDEEPKGVSPLTKKPCVAWAAELTCKRWLTRHVMLRDGASFGFDIRLDDGRLARIPAGMVRLHRGGREDDSPAVATDYLQQIDPAYRADDEEPPIPYDEAATLDLRPGDRVEIFGELHVSADPGAAETYRGTTAMVLRPTDVPLIRRV